MSRGRPITFGASSGGSNSMTPLSPDGMCDGSSGIFQASFVAWPAMSSTSPAGSRNSCTSDTGGSACSWQRVVEGALGQRLALDIIHGIKMLTFMRTYFVDGDNVRM